MLPALATDPPIAPCRATNISTKTCLPHLRIRTTLKALRSRQASRDRPLPTLSHIATRVRLSLPRVMHPMPAPTRRKLTTHLLMQAPMSHNGKVPTKDTTTMVKTMALRHLLVLANPLEAIRNQRLHLRCRLGSISHYGAPRLVDMTSHIANTRVNYQTEGHLSQMPRSLHIPQRRRCPLGPTTPQMITIHSTTGHPAQTLRLHPWALPRTLDQHRPDYNGTQRMHHCRSDLPTMNLRGPPDTNGLRATT